MAKQKRIQFTVEGSGAFPFDMLRYDQAFPARESPDSYLIGLNNLAGDEYFGARQVTLLSDCPHAPTINRWKSFNWRVVSSDKWR
jgi:hypothetical protein